MVLVDLAKLQLFGRTTKRNAEKCKKSVLAAILFASLWTAK
jgi:hypothetical protein